MIKKTPDEAAGASAEHTLSYHDDAGQLRQIKVRGRVIATGAPQRPHGQPSPVANVQIALYRCTDGPSSLVTNAVVRIVVNLDVHERRYMTSGHDTFWGALAALLEIDVGRIMLGRGMLPSLDERCISRALEEAQRTVRLHEDIRACFRHAVTLLAEDYYDRLFSQVPLKDRHRHIPATKTS